MDDRRRIGLLMDFMVPSLIEGAGAYAKRHGLRLDARWSVRADWMPEKPGWDGVLVHLIDMENAYQRAMELGLPMLHLSGWLGERARPRVECNYALCGAMAAEEFRKLGLRRVAARTGWRSGIDWRSHRGFRVAAKKAGLEFNSLRAPERGVPWMLETERLANEVLGLKFPCGLFLPHAGSTVTLLDLLAERGIRVPEDVAIIVIDKDPHHTAELAPVPLTAVMPDFWQQGYQAAEWLDKMIQGQPPTKTILLVPPSRLVRRESTGVTVSRDPVVAKVLHLIAQRAGRELEVPELARLAGVSRRTLETKFRCETGMTLHAAQLQRRIQESKRLLRQPQAVISEVAYECGYSSIHYFTTSFKRAVGMTPSEYRKQMNDSLA